MNKNLLYLVILFFCSSISSQEIFKKIDATNFQENNTEKPKAFEQFQLSTTRLLKTLNNVSQRGYKRSTPTNLSLPNGLGGFEVFEVFESQILNIELSKKYPTIKSYVGKSTQSAATVRFSYSPSQGFNAALSNNKSATVLIKPSDLKNERYRSYSRKDIIEESNFECNTIEKLKENTRNLSSSSNRVSNDGFLRKYRLAVATTAEYSNYFLDGTEVDDTERKTKVLAAINASLTRINGIFERDFAITMELVSNTDSTIFLNPSSDPFNGDFNSELQNTLDSTIGDSNYDVGHLFGYEGSTYGSAGCIACVCTSGSKGSGFTIHNAPDSDHFNMIASHEFGHQFGGFHVQSSSNCRSAIGLQEVEPGSGSSIMGYAGICYPNVQENPDDYFNYVDIRDIIQWTQNESSCAELIATGNNDPIANAGINYTIPKSTAFVLEGTASDVDSNSNLTYCWEENDPEDPYSSDYPSSTRVFGPMYRSRLPVSEPLRYMPQLSDVLAGDLTPTWEVTPSVSRTLDFVLTVRDNALLGAKTASDDMTVTVDANFNPFRVTSQNSSVTWSVGDVETITWDVANTTNTPINAATVDVFLSIDGGYTYPYIIANNIANDGSETIVVPEISSSTTEARFMVKASNNIFFAINGANITIQTSEFLMRFGENKKNVCTPSSVSYNFTYNTFLGFSELTTFSTEDVPANVNVSFNPTTASVDGTEVEVIINNTTNFPLGLNPFIVKGTSLNVTKKSVINLSVYSNTISQPSLSSPSNNQNNSDTNTTFRWDSNNNAENYAIEIATDNLFTSIIDSSTLPENNYTSNNLKYNTPYFWRVQATNPCGESLFSDTYNFTTLCSPPDNINLNNIGANSVNISWTELGDSTSWEIEIVNQGIQPTGSGTEISLKPYIINNLNSGENYDIYLRSVCSESNSSSWAGPVSFSTLADFCNGNHFYDSGGAFENYGDNENKTTVVSLNGADIIEATFLSFSLEDGFDVLYVFDGPDTNAPFIGYYTGNTIPPVIRSSEGNNLTFHFISDDSVTYSGWEVDISCITVTCPAPSEITSSNLTSNTVDLNWTSNGTETEWEIEYGETGFNQGTGTTLSTTTNPFTLNGLSPVTNYDIYVRAICGTIPGTDDSFRVGPIAIETPCDEFIAPYFYDVEQQTNGIIEDCWTSNPPTYTGNYFWTPFYGYQYDTETGPYQANSGNLFFASYPYNGASSGDVTELYTPIINIASLNVPVLDFYSFMHGENVGSLHVDVLNNGVWTDDILVINGEQQSEARDLWQEQIVDLSGFEERVQIRFRAISGGYGINEIDLDDISVVEMPSCPNPSNFEISNITYESAELNWTSNGTETVWEIEYGDVGFTQGNGTTVSVSTNPFTLNGLSPVTNYDIYVRAICGTIPGTDDSFRVGPIAIETPCDEFIAPYFYDVEQQTNGIIEDCWTSNPTFQTGNYFWTPFYGYQYDTETGPYQAKSGNLFFASYPYNGASSGDVTELYTPIINIASLNVPVLDFYSFMHGENVGSLHVDVLNNGVWTDDILVINGEQQSEARDLWQEQIVDLSGFEERVQIRFRAISGGYGINEIDLDDISVVEMPSCPNPSNFEISNITYESAELNWTSNGTETVWEIEYGDVGFTQGNGTTVSVSTNPFTLNGLSPVTNYDIYVRAICGTIPGTDDSFRVGPIAIETPCDEFIAPYFYDVEQQTNGIIEDCWTSNPTFQTGNYFWTPFYGYQYDTETGPYQAKSGNLFFASYPYNGASSGDVTELYTPIINIASLNVPVLDFYSFMHGENVGSLHVDVLNNGVWTDDILVINGEQQSEARDLWQEQIVDLSGFEERVQIRFRAISGGYGINEIDLDDISVVEMPSCPNPSNFEISNITYESAELNWTSNSTETVWEIEYGDVGFTQGTGTTVSTTTNPFVLSNLNSQTNYDVYLRATCGASPGTDDSQWIGPVSIKTLADYCNGDHFYDSGGENQNYQNGENEITVISPISSDYVIVEFLDLNLESCCDQLSIYDGPDMNAPFLGRLTGNSLPETFTSTHSTGTLTFHFTSDSSVTGRGWDAKVSCISESCPAPSNTTISNIGTDQVTLNWEAGNTEDKWEIEYGLSNFTQGSGTKIIATNTTHSLTNLIPGKSYQYYLRAICGSTSGEDDSHWTGPYTFTTNCGNIVAPFYENFNLYSRPNCWDEQGFEPWNFNINAEHEASTAGDNSPEQNTNYAWVDGSLPNGEFHLSKLITPWIDISNLTNPAISFSLFSVNTISNTYNTFKVIIYDDNDRHELLMVKESTEGWKNYILDLSNLEITNTILIEFIVVEDSPWLSEFNDILIDEIKVDEIDRLDVITNTISSFKYYPNPVKNSLSIQSSESINLVTIKNILGQEVYRHKPESLPEIEIDISKLSDGTYIVKAVSDNKLHNFKIIKKSE